MISSCAIHWEGLVGWGCVLLRLDPMGVLLVPVRGGGGHWLSGEVGLRGGVGRRWTTSMVRMLGRRLGHFWGIGHLFDGIFPGILGILCCSWGDYLCSLCI